MVFPMASDGCYPFLRSTGLIRSVRYFFVD